MAVIVDGDRERSRIAELESLTAQMRWWRWGATLFITIFLLSCLIILNSKVRGLTSPGPTQDEFVQNLNTSLQTDTVPTLEHEASATLTEIQPEIKASVLKLRDHVPELAQSAEDQVRLLQQDLPAKGEAILNRRFASIITSREATIRKMYPSVTPEQINLLVVNLTEHAKTQVEQANNDLFGHHQARLQSILASMDTIRSQEANHVKDEQPDWEMGVLLLDVFKDDLKSLAQPGKTPAKGVTSTKPIATRSLGKGGV